MVSRKIVLFLASAFITILFFQTPTVNFWVKDKILIFTEEFYDGLGIMELEERRLVKLQGYYQGSIATKHILPKLKIDSPLLLVPPASYYKQFDEVISIPEPIVFYYFTGIRTTQMNCADVYKANCAMIFEEKLFQITKITERRQIDSVLARYKSVKATDKTNKQVSL
jgi:hypothetical protein